jgi:hypothetical protein
MLDVLLGVLKRWKNLLAVRVQKVGLGRAALLHRHRPASVLDTRSDVTGQGIRVGSREVQVLGARGAVVRVEGVHGLDFAGVGVHAAGRLAGLDVAPDHGRHVALVVHEAGVEVGGFVRVGRYDVCGAAREGVLEEVEHCEELARRHNHVVAKPSSNDRVMHDGLIRFVLEVAVPARAELRAWPAVHHLQLLLGRTDLDTSFDTVGGERTSAIDVPLVEDPFLRRWVAASKVVETLDMGLRAVGREREARIKHQPSPFMQRFCITY